MTSVIVPPVDLAPGMPSRVVTISATDVTEGGKSLEGQMVRFALSDSLDVTSGGDVIAKTQAEVVLDSQGNGSIRLPVYDSAVQTWCGQDWAILVTATWGSQKAIRVPAGTGSIALSALPNVRPLRGREKQWAITGVTVSVSEGTPGGSGSVSDGILRLNLRYPRSAYYLGEVGAGVDLNTLTWTDEAGLWRLNAGLADSYVHAPAALAGSNGGILEVIGDGLMTHQYVRIRGTSDIYWRAMTNYQLDTWTPWEDLNGTKFYRGRIPNGSDVFTLGDGAWTVSSAGFAETMTNLPEAWPGTFTMMGSNEPIVRAATFRPYNRDYHWETVRAIGGGWMPWRKVSAASSDGEGSALSPAYAPNAIQQATMVHHYGPVDTGGRGAVAWRIDHGLANFKTKMLPIFRAAGIVPMITLNSRSWDNPENAGVTQSEVNTWVSNGWVEISNHGATHSNVTGDAAIEAYVAEGLGELEQQLPAAKGKIFGFHIAGVGVQGAFGGFQGGDTPARWDTVMGRAILRNHAFGSGYVPGTNLRVLDGQIRQGLYHTGTDTAAVSTITGLIDQAIAQRRGFQIMSHPSNLDTAGYHSTAMIQQIVDHIVAKRDAGALAVLSPYQLMLADASMSERDTGRLTVTGLFSEVTNGQIYLRRVGNMVHVTLYDVEFGDSTPPDFFYLADRLPVGYRPDTLTSFPALAGSDSVRRVRFQPDGRVLFYTITATTRLNLTASYLTPDSWPS